MYIKTNSHPPRHSELNRLSTLRMLGQAILLLSVGTALAGVSVRMPYLGSAGVTYNVPTPHVPFHQFGARISSVAYGNGAFLGRAYGPAVVPGAPLVAAAPLVQPAVSTVHHVPAVAQVPITKLEHQPAVVQSVVDVAKASVATKKFEIRRPAIEKEFYDIEERVIVRPVGKAVVELDQPEAKSQKGPTVIQPASVHAVSAAPPLAFAAHSLPAFAARTSLALPALARTAHVYSYPFQGPSYLQHHTIAVSSTPRPVPQEESEPELIRPDDPAQPQPENPIEPQPQPAPYPPQQSEPQQQPFPAQQPDPQAFPAQQPDPQPFPPQQDASDTDSESVSIDNPEISARSQQQQPRPVTPSAQDPQIDEYNNQIARQRSNALEQQLQITRAQTEAQKALLARLQAMSDAQEQLLARSRQELQAQEELLTRAKQQREQEILFRAREQQVQEQQLLSNVRQQQELMARARQQQEQDQQILARARQQQDIQARTALYGERLNFENQAIQGSAPSQDERADSISVEVRSRDGRMRNAAETTATQTLDVIPSTRLSAEESLTNQEKLIDLLTARGGVTEIRNAGGEASSSSAAADDAASVRGRVLSVTPAPERSSSPLNERVNTRRVVVNRRIQTVQNVDIVEPFTKIERVAVHRPALLQTARVGVAHVPTSLPVHTVHHAPSFVAYRH